MSNFKFINLLFASLSMVILFSIGCANKKNSNSGGIRSNAYCTTGLVRSQSYGCIPQGNCPSNHGFYNNQCIPLGNVGGQCGAGQVFINSGGCVPQGQCPANYGFYNNRCVPGTIASTPVNNGYQYGAGACGGGQIYSFYGCIPTAGCPSNQGMYNGSCIPPLNIGGNGVPNNFNSSYGYYPYSSGGGIASTPYNNGYSYYGSNYNMATTPYGYYYYPNYNTHYYQGGYPSMYFQFGL